MNFQDLQYHIEQFGCSLDHLEENLYWASNCINAHVCQIEDHKVYSEVTLCHYFYELGIPAPDELQHAYVRYKEMRERIVVGAESHK